MSYAFSVGADLSWHYDQVVENEADGSTVAYPNPGGNTLNIHTALPNARMEVYDINGRLIHGQALTQQVTAIDATDWVKGVYVWKVYVSDGGPSMGSGTLVETGKWIKE